MRKALVVARREYAAMVRTKAFLVTILVMPVMMLGGIVLQRVLAGRVDVADKRILVLDGTGVLFDELAQAVAVRNELDIRDPASGRQVRPRLVLERGPGGPVSDERRLDLSERVRRNEILGFVELDPRVLEPLAARTAEELEANRRAVYHAENLAAQEALRRFQVALNTVVIAHRLRAAGLDPALVGPAVQPVLVKSTGLYSRGPDGRPKKADEAGSEIARFVPVILMLLMFMSIMIAAQPMLQSVLEEKQQRIAEVLLGSARPFDLMLGKLLGNVAVSLTILAIYFAGIYLSARHYDYLELVPTHLAGWFLIYDVLAILLFGSIFLAVGSACTELKEAQNYLMPVMLLLVLPTMVWFEVMRAPMSSFSIGVSLFPLATPILMPMRMAASSAVPLWQPLLGAVLMLAATLVCVFAAGRIFRIGLLSQGKAPRFAELLGWIVRG